MTSYKCKINEYQTNCPLFVESKSNCKTCSNSVPQNDKVCPECGEMLELDGYCPGCDSIESDLLYSNC